MLRDVISAQNFNLVATRSVIVVACVTSLRHNFGRLRASAKRYMHAECSMQRLDGCSPNMVAL
jgi:hypothetical protein